MRREELEHMGFVWQQCYADELYTLLYILFDRSCHTHILIFKKIILLACRIGIGYLYWYTCNIA